MELVVFGFIFDKELFKIRKNKFFCDWVICASDNKSSLKKQQK